MPKTCHLALWSLTNYIHIERRRVWLIDSRCSGSVNFTSNIQLHGYVDWGEYLMYLYNKFQVTRNKYAMESYIHAISIYRDSVEDDSLPVFLSFALSLCIYIYIYIHTHAMASCFDDFSSVGCVCFTYSPYFWVKIYEFVNTNSFICNGQILSKWNYVATAISNEFVPRIPLYYINEITPWSNQIWSRSRSVFIFASFGFS